MRLAIWIYGIHDTIQLDNIRVYVSDGYICEDEFRYDKHIKKKLPKIKVIFVRLKKDNTTTLWPLVF